MYQSKWLTWTLWKSVFRYINWCKLVLIRKIYWLGLGLSSYLKVQLKCSWSGQGQVVMWWRGPTEADNEKQLKGVRIINSLDWRDACFIHWLYLYMIDTSVALVKVCLALVKVCLSLVKVCLSLVKVCLALVKVCLSLVKVCLSLVKVCLALVKVCFR